MLRKCRGPARVTEMAADPRDHEHMAFLAATPVSLCQSPAAPRAQGSMGRSRQHQENCGGPVSKAGRGEGGVLTSAAL